MEMEFYRPSCVRSCPEQLARIIHQCIRCNPNSRPSAATVCDNLRAAIASLAPPVPDVPRDVDNVLADPAGSSGRVMSPAQAVANTAHAAGDMHGEQEAPVLPDTIPVYLHSISWDANQVAAGREEPSPPDVPIDAPLLATRAPMASTGRLAAQHAQHAQHTQHGMQQGSGGVCADGRSTATAAQLAAWDALDQRGTDGEDWFHPPGPAVAPPAEPVPPPPAEPVPPPPEDPVVKPVADEKEGMERAKEEDGVEDIEEPENHKAEPPQRGCLQVLLCGLAG